MAPILNQSAVNTRSADLQNGHGRRSDNDQRAQFGDVLSNVSGKASSTGQESPKTSGTTKEVEGDQKSRAGHHSSDDDGPGSKDDAQGTPLVATGAVIDLTTLAAEVAGTIQAASTAALSKTPTTPIQPGGSATISDLPNGPTVAISDVALQTHLDTTPTPPAASVDAAASFGLVKADTDPKQLTAKSDPNAPTPTAANAAGLVVKADGAGSKGEDSGSDSSPSGQNDHSASKKTSKVEDVPASEPSQKADATTATQVVLVPAGISTTQAIVKAISTTLVQHSPTLNASDTVATTTIAPPRTLTLQLTPAGMGTVSVTMHAIGQALDLHLSVSNSDTLGTINRDRDTLAKSVADQGYDLRTLVILGKDGANVSSDTSSQGQGNAQAGSDRQSAQNRGSGLNQSKQTPQRTPSNETPTAAARPRADALFV